MMSIYKTTRGIELVQPVNPNDIGVFGYLPSELLQKIANEVELLNKADMLWEYDRHVYSPESYHEYKTWRIEQLRQIIL